MRKFSYVKNLRKAVVAGLSSYLMAAYIGLPIDQAIGFGLLGLISGSAVNVMKYRKGK